MRLGELIHEYREAHDLSQRQFADMCKLSNGYVSMLERGVNPNTGKPITPTIPQLKKLADGMGTTIAEIIEKVDDMPIDLIVTSEEAKNAPAEGGKGDVLDEVDVAFYGEFKELSEDDKEIVRSMVATMRQRRGKI